ncbi:DNA-directed RNA polymerase subunit H [archaeon]|jgi:DNA-directed RNA polymerase subunit H (RpoH/RPB5)|nr:DNA-directed RNA polymerase subunit H [archaeon]MBT4417075.1 DNA-directed RNA polymerase subunit H [archaeon]
MAKKIIIPQVDVSSHRLVPKHIRLTDDEKKVVLDKYNIALSQLPRISRADPALFEMEINPGDIIKIIRPSVARGEVDYFRVVI